MSPLLIRCANTRCENVVDEIGKLCPECQRREREATPWISQLVKDAEAERRRRKIEQDNKHRKGGEE